MLFFICDFCQNRATQIVKVPCLTFSPEEGFIFARILNSEATAMNICTDCLAVDTK